MSDPSQPTPPPVPRYGEYAPEGYVPPVQPQPLAPQPGSSPYVAPGGSRRKTWDLVLTVILLVMGFFGALFGVIYGVVFTQPELLADALAQQGYPGFAGDTAPVAPVLIFSHVLLYLAAMGIAIPLLIRRRVAFWAPLVAGVLAAIIFWGCLFAAIASDPAFLQNLS